MGGREIHRAAPAGSAPTAATLDLIGRTALRYFAESLEFRRAQGAALAAVLGWSHSSGAATFVPLGVGALPSGELVESFQFTLNPKTTDILTI